MTSFPILCRPELCRPVLCYSARAAAGFGELTLANAAEMELLVRVLDKNLILL